MEEKENSASVRTLLTMLGILSQQRFAFGEACDAAWPGLHNRCHRPYQTCSVYQTSVTSTPQLQPTHTASGMEDSPKSDLTNLETATVSNHHSDELYSLIVSPIASGQV